MINFNDLRIFGLFCLFVAVSKPAYSEDFYRFDGEKEYIAKLDGALDVLGPEKHKKYENLLKQMKCDEAYSLLNKAFVSHYPQYEHATESGGTGHRDWKAHIVPRFYPEADLCSDVENLQFSEMLAKRIGAKIGAYVYGKQWRENLPINYNETWASRDWMIGGIITLASDGHHPALIELAKLHQRGDVFEAGPEAEYYLLKRACHYNVRCEEIMSRIAELEAKLEAKLPPDLQREVAAKAMKDEFDHKAMGLTADE